VSDLTDITSALSVKILGADLTGLETYPMAVSAIGEAEVVEALKVGAVFGAVSVSSTAVEARVGGSRYANRKLLTIIPTNGTLYYGYSNSVTVATGTPIFKNQLCILAVADVAVWLIAANATDVRITEGA
jgi:hypothetical protein